MSKHFDNTQGNKMMPVCAYDQEISPQAQMALCSVICFFVPFEGSGHQAPRGEVQARAERWRDRSPSSPTEPSGVHRLEFDKSLVTFSQRERPESVCKSNKSTKKIMDPIAGQHLFCQLCMRRWFGPQFRAWPPPPAHTVDRSMADTSISTRMIN